MDLQWAKHPLARRLRAHGFGVHSPFAFDFIRRVLAQPCAYYCYADINRLATSRRDAACARLLFRVVLHFRPEAIAITPGVALSAAMTAALKAVQPLATLSQRPGLFTICDPTFDGPIEENAVVFSLRPYTDPVETLAPAFGMTFAGSSGSVYVGLSHLPRQTFELID